MSNTSSPLATRQQFIDAITGDAFAKWQSREQVAENLRTGNAWRHTPDSIDDPPDHSPHELTQCHRKTYYKTHNTPKEDESPDGVFWVGSRIEEDRIQPFLEDIATAGSREAFVQNSMWVDYERRVSLSSDSPTVATPSGTQAIDATTDAPQTQTDTTTIRIRGATDPVICTRQGEPILPTEVKTRDSLEGLDATDPTPSPHHAAQLHAYLAGLDQTVEYTVDQGLVIYVDRTHHDLRAIPVEFDAAFWRDTVCRWAATQTAYRDDEELPPAEPTYDWECEYCSYQTRCGQTAASVEDASPEGFVPLRQYPQDRVTAALEAEGGAMELTPTLAHQHPDLAQQYPVRQWSCPACGSEFQWDDPDCEGIPAEQPSCPACARQHRFAPLQPRQISPKDDG